MGKKFKKLLWQMGQEMKMRQEWTFLGSCNVPSFDRDLGYTGVYMWQNSSNGPPKTCIFYCV